MPEREQKNKPQQRARTFSKKPVAKPKAVEMGETIDLADRVLAHVEFEEQVIKGTVKRKKRKTTCGCDGGCGCSKCTPTSCCAKPGCKEKNNNE